MCSLSHLWLCCCFPSVPTVMFHYLKLCIIEMCQLSMLIITPFQLDIEQLADCLVTISSLYRNPYLSPCSNKCQSNQTQWLLFTSRIKYKFFCLTFKGLSNLNSIYCVGLIIPYNPLSPYSTVKLALSLFFMLGTPSHNPKPLSLLIPRAWNA